MAFTIAQSLGWNRVFNFPNITITSLSVQIYNNGTGSFNAPHGVGVAGNVVANWYLCEFDATDSSFFGPIYYRFLDTVLGEVFPADATCDYVVGYYPQDPVWSASLPGAYSAGQAGYILGHSGSDPWTTALPGSYSAGQAGHILGTNLDATVSSRSTYAGGAVASVTGGVGGSVAGSVGSVVGTIGGLTAAALSQFFTVDSGQVYSGAIAGSVVHEIAANAGGSDPWATSLPGAYSAGQAGYIVGTNLDATVSSRSTYAGGAVASVTGGVGGSVAGSVGSVTGGVGGSVASVAGNVGGNVLGTVSAIAGVSFPANFGSLVISTAGRVAIQSAVITDTGIAAFPFIMFSSADHVTPVSGLTVSAQRSIDGGAFASCAYSPTSVGNGDYVIQLASTDVNGSWIVLIFTAVGADPTFAVLGTTP